MDNLQKYKKIYNTLVFAGVILGLAFLLLNSFSNHSRVIWILETVFLFIDIILFSIGVVFFIKIIKIEKSNKKKKAPRRIDWVKWD